MDNREIEEIVLGIRLPEILEAIIEVFGEEYRDIIIERSKDVTFFGRVSNTSFTKMYIDVVIKSLTNFCIECQDNLYEYDKIEEAKERIKELQEIKVILNECADKILKLERRKDNVISDKLEEFRELFPNKKGWIYTIYSFCMEYDGININEFYKKHFADLLGINTTDLIKNQDFNLILDYAKEIKEIKDKFDKQINGEDPIYSSALAKIKVANLIGFQTNKDIEAVFLNRDSDLVVNEFITAGTTYLLKGIDGLMKVLVGISINMDATDRNIIHEIIHVITSFAKDGKYFSGFYCNGDISEEYVNLLEVCVDWLAVKVLLVYLRDNCPMVNPVINQTLYSRCFVDCAYFLENFEKQIIEALMYGDLSLINESLGKNTIEKIATIMGKIMHQEELTSDEKELLDGFASPTSNIN